MTLPENQVSLKSALEKVDTLTCVTLHDEQPCIEALSLSIHYRAKFDTNFEDKNAFVSSVAKYKEQATGQAVLNQLLEEGEEYAVMIYTWRCCSRAIPQVQSNNQVNKEEIYQQTVDVLKPLIDKLMKFMDFQAKAIERFCDEVKQLCHKGAKNDFVSEAYLLTLGKLLNMFAVLNELMNMKASVNNDYSVYKRAAQNLKQSGDQEAMQKLSLSLATQNKIRDTLKIRVSAIPGYEELIIDIVNICVMMYEKDMYLEPTEKHMLVKVMAFGLFIMDTPTGPNIYRLNDKRKVNLSKIDKILKQLEMVPLYGDMMIAPYSFIKTGPNYDASKWPACESSSLSPQSNLLGGLEMIKERHMQYISRLTKYNNESSARMPGTKKTDAENQELTDLALKGLALLSKWTQQVMELYSWKLMNPTKPEVNPNCPENAEEYERATRYNYSSEEKFAIVEVIAMIKGLQLFMARLETLFMDAIKHHIYGELQEFVQSFLREPLRKATSKKKDVIRVVIMSVRETCADWFDGTEPKTDPALVGKKDPPEGFGIKVPRKNVGPSSTQLYMVRTMLESLIDERSGGKKSVRRDHIAVIEEFHKKSFFWSYLINFNETLFNCGDLSQLWYREFFLELTMGKRIQFPIEMSMPWILTDHILETKEPSMMEYILYPLDLYNDSAQYALMRFRKQFLYDEVEAEVNLCFDMLVYKLSDQIFAYYKQLAGCIMLDRRFRNECISQGIKNDYPAANRYLTLLKQRHVQLLGRSIDLNSLISPMVNLSLQKSLSAAISKFEAGDLTGIVELEGLIEMNRLAHKLLSEYLILDDFEVIFIEANQIEDSRIGRLILHIFHELTLDIMPNYCYNSSTNRFVKSAFLRLVQGDAKEKLPKSSKQYVWGSKQLNSSFYHIYSLYTGFFGTPHIRAICRLLDYHGLAIIISLSVEIVEVLVTGQILEDAKVLMESLPPKCNLPLFSYGSPGILAFYKSQLDSFMQFTILKTDVFQTFNKMGNAILFCMLLEQNLNQEEVHDLKQAAPFQNIIPKPFIPKDPKETKEPAMTVAEVMKQLERKYASLHVVPIIEKLGSKEQADIIKEGDLLTKDRLCCNLSIFEFILQKIRTFMGNKLWHGSTPANGVMNLDTCDEFHRLWSAVQFVYCIPVGDHEFTIEEMFGEGLNWAGCVLITVLGQQRRFEALDFSYHLLKAHRQDMKDDAVSNLKKLAERIRKF
ncbi:unnamed protein product [Lymnaea stagnalis]|uniref:Cytoplasmic FMR1-interacting protein n=1 Tax=Lymnaea stagnalis TaxID=6523 RepID=A0AAV2I337_LYMST